MQKPNPGPVNSPTTTVPQLTGPRVTDVIEPACKCVLVYWVHDAIRTRLSMNVIFARGSRPGLISLSGMLLILLFLSPVPPSLP